MEIDSRFETFLFERVMIVVIGDGVIVYVGGCKGGGGADGGGMYG